MQIICFFFQVSTKKREKMIMTKIKQKTNAFKKLKKKTICFCLTEKNQFCLRKKTSGVIFLRSKKNLDPCFFAEAKLKGLNHSYGTWN